MTLKEWYEFNKSVFGRISYEIHVFKNGSYNTRDQILEFIVNDLEATVSFFEGKNMKLQKVMIDTRDNGATLVPFVCLILWPENG